MLIFNHLRKIQGLKWTGRMSIYKHYVNAPCLYLPGACSNKCSHFFTCEFRQDLIAPHQWHYYHMIRQLSNYNIWKNYLLTGIINGVRAVGVETIFAEMLLLARLGWDWFLDSLPPLMGLGISWCHTLSDDYTIADWLRDYDVIVYPRRVAGRRHLWRPFKLPNMVTCPVKG